MRIILSIILLCCTQWAFGQFTQYTPKFKPFSQYYYQQAYYNPAYIGNDSQPQYWFSTRTTQEPNLSRGRSYNALANWSMIKIPISWGVVFAYEDFQDNTYDSTIDSLASSRDFTEWQLGLQTSFDFDMGEEGLGKIGFTGTAVRLRNAGTTASLNGQNPRNFVFNMDVGVLAVYNRFKLGFSMVHSNEPNYFGGGGINTSSGGNTGGGIGVGGGISTGGSSSGGGNFLSRFRRTGYFHASFDWRLTESLTFTPQIFARQIIGQNGNLNNSNANFGGSDDGPCSGANLPGSSLDVGFILNYYNLIFAGFSYRPCFSHSRDNIYRDYFGSVMVGFRLNETYHVSTSWDLRRRNTDNYYRQFEIGIGAFLLRPPDYAEASTDY